MYPSCIPCMSAWICIYAYKSFECGRFMVLCVQGTTLGMARQVGAYGG